MHIVGLVPPVGWALAGVLAASPLTARGHHWSRGASRGDRGGGSLGRVHVGLLLRLDNVLLVADALVAEPVTNLEREKSL